MATPRVKNSLNANLFPKNYETNLQPSMTIPDQTMTVKEIMDRYARGLPLDGERVPMYELDDEADFDSLQSMLPDNFAHLDLADKQRIREEHGEYLKFLQERMKSMYRKPNPKKTPPEANEEEPVQLVSDNTGSEADGKKSQGAAAKGSKNKGGGTPSE